MGNVAKFGQSRLLAVLLAAVLCCGSECHKRDLERKAESECEALGGFRSWQEWNEYFGCQLVGRRNVCTAMLCGDAGCEASYPTCTQPVKSGEGRHRSPDDWIYELDIVETGRTGSPVPGNHVRIKVRRSTLFWGCHSDYCTSSSEDDPGERSRCPYCVGPAVGDRSSGTECCVDVEVGTGSSVGWGFASGNFSGSSCGLGLIPTMPAGDAGYMTVRTAPAQCNWVLSDMKVP
jgi:hypothetical protein